jgi:hypothetical protein
MIIGFSAMPERRTKLKASKNKFEFPLPNGDWAPVYIYRFCDYEDESVYWTTRDISKEDLDAGLAKIQEYSNRWQANNYENHSREIAKREEFGSLLDGTTPEADVKYIEYIDNPPNGFFIDNPWPNEKELMKEYLGLIPLEYDVSERTPMRANRHPETGEKMSW